MRTQGVQLIILARTLRRVSSSGTAGSIAAARSSGSTNGRISMSESSIDQVRAFLHPVNRFLQ